MAGGSCGTRLPSGGVRALHDRLSAFVQAVAALPKKASWRKVMDLVKGAVLDIGEIHQRHGSFLDTAAREDVVGFIHEVVAGFDLGDGDDLTERWRRW